MQTFTNQTNKFVSNGNGCDLSSHLIGQILLWHVLGSFPLSDGPFQVRLEGGVPVSNRPLNALRRICDLPLSSKSRKIKCRFIAAYRISTPNRILILYLFSA